MEGRRHSDLPHWPISQGTILVSSKLGANFTLIPYNLPSYRCRCQKSSSRDFYGLLLFFEACLNGCCAISIHLSVYRDIWSDVFSPKGKAGDKASPLTTMTAWDLRNSFGQKISKHNSNKEVSEYTWGLAWHCNFVHFILSFLVLPLSIMCATSNLLSESMDLRHLSLSHLGILLAIEQL